MKYLLDTGLWIELALRYQSRQDIVALYKTIEDINSHTCLPMCGYNVIHHTLSQHLGSIKTDSFLYTLFNQRVEFLPFTDKEIRTATKLPFSHYSDALVAATAFNHQCDYIITDFKDSFSRSPVPISGVQAMLEDLQGN